VIEMKTNECYRFLITFILLLSVAFVATAQTGGGFDLSHNVITGGGGSNSAGGGFVVDGAVGQPVAGTLSFGGVFNLRGGFWAFAANVPTGASVYVSGQVTVINGKGLSEVTVTLSDIFTNTTYSTTTDKRGYFLFEDLTITHFYILRVERKQYIFAPEGYTFELTGNLENVNFTGILQPPQQ
jgi:hypothetical protein